MIRFLSTIFGIFLLTLSVAQADIAKPKALSDTLALMADALQQEDLISEVTIDHADQSLAVTYTDDSEITAFPDNLHAKLSSAGSDAERQTIFDEHIATIIAVYHQQDEALSPADHAQIYPVLRHRDYRTFTDSQSPEAKLVTAGSIGDTDILFVLDSPKSVQFIKEGDLAALELDMKALEEVARTNLARKKQELRVEGGGPYMLILDGFYEASMLLDDALWDSIEDQVGAVLLAMPNRDLIFFLPAATPDAEKTLRGLIAEYGAALPYPLSDHVFRRNGSDWVVVQP